MPTVVGVSLRSAGKIYYFDPGSQRYHAGERVLVETARGLELGTVRLAPHEVDESQVTPPLKGILRRATAADFTRATANREREEQALRICKRLIEKLDLPMRLINVEYNFDGSHVLIHFLAEHRVDFRELVRELARELRARIELRQVGVRDEAKLLGGYGICGRALCCAAFLTNFVPVAITAAKAQGLALNPQKISGSCGRLMCCLAYEYEHYRESHIGMPRVNARVETPRGPGKITKLNVLARQVEVAIADAPGPVWFSVDELHGAALTGACPSAEGHCAGCRAHHAGDDVEEAAAEPTAPPSPDEGATPAPRKRRPRRRKKAAITEAAPPAPVAPSVATTAPPRRRRRRKPTPAAMNTAGPLPAPASAGSPPPAVSGQYKPRKRHR